MSTKKKTKKTKQIETRNLDDNNFTRFPLDASFQGVRSLFLLLTILIMAPTNLKEKITKNIFFSRVNITNYNVLIDGRNFYDQQGWFLHSRVFVRLSVR